MRPVSSRDRASNSSAISMSRRMCRMCRGGANTAGDSVSSSRTLFGGIEIADIGPSARPRRDLRFDTGSAVRRAGTAATRRQCHRGRSSVNDGVRARRPNRARRPLAQSANRIVSSGAQVPPAGVTPTSATMRTVAVAHVHRHEFAVGEKSDAAGVGDQNGFEAPSVFSNALSAEECSVRIQRAFRPLALSRATKASGCAVGRQHAAAICSRAVGRGLKQLNGTYRVMRWVADSWTARSRLAAISQSRDTRSRSRRPPSAARPRVSVRIAYARARQDPPQSSDDGASFRAAGRFASARASP